MLIKQSVKRDLLLINCCYCSYILLSLFVHQIIKNWMLLFRPVFPKVRSADLFWSARVSNLVLEKKKLLLILYLKSTHHKICQFYCTKFNFLVHGINFIDLVVRQIFFESFMVRKQKKFGKHWCNVMWV